MGENLQLQLYSSFLGTNEGIRSIILPDVFSSSGSQNLFIDILGRARKLKGYSKQNSAAITTTTGGSACKITSLYPYRKTASGAITRQLIGTFDDANDEYELKYSTNDGVTWTDITDYGYPSVGSMADYAQYEDTVFITNGIVAPRAWNGTTLSVAGATQSPTPTGAVTDDAGELTGAYRYKLVSIEEDGTRSPGSISSDVIPVTAGKINLTWAADSNTEVIGYEIYRTTGSGSVFYFTYFIEGRTNTEYLDNIKDPVIFTNRALAEHGDPPPTVKFVEAHKGRMWWGGTADKPTRVWWSDPGDPDSVYDQNYLDFSDSTIQGDVLTGMMGNFGEQLVVFTEKSVWTVSGTGALLDYIIDWNKDRKNTQTGCVSHRSVARVPAGAKYVNQNGNIVTLAQKALAYFTPLGDIRLFDGQSDSIISDPIKETLRTFNYEYRNKIHCVHNATVGEFIWFIPVDNHSECRKAVSWNYRWGVWYVWSPQPFACAVESENSISPHFILAGEAEITKGGYLYKLFQSNSFDGDAIESVWFTKTLRGVVNVKDDLEEALSYTKRWRWIDLVFSAEGSPTLTVKWYDAEEPDFGAVISSSTVTPFTVNLVTADGDPIVSADGDYLTTAKPITQRKVLFKHSDGRYPHTEGIRIRISESSATAGWAIEAFTVAYQLLEGLKRRSE